MGTGLPCDQDEPGVELPGPKGHRDLTAALQRSNVSYAVRGTLALPDQAVIAPPRLALVYSSDVAAVAAPPAGTYRSRRQRRLV